ncbi:FtsW/RodA/SpoVE family cell cycle protein [Paenibacillus sp. MY03]|jgi:cell division protein FtsW (lipid II flippase)|uniref:FtsW/RodA/SpoVE family cell cycle protein n=1 Tax=Paenibacillus sp. MY03 TaxID=302980 RepID=UPI0015C58537|nr:FtsW/RodA/SpoVE family cell cycle protein [Paenibacillus sp. MY03]
MTMVKSILTDPAVAAYLDTVCSQVKAKAVHDDIRLEIAGHLEELVSEMLESGLKTEEAVAEALKAMGNPVEIGKGLHAAHRPSMEWNLIGLIAIMVVLAVVSLVAVHTSDERLYRLEPVLVYGAIGITAMVVMMFVNYRRLLRLSWPLYWGTVVIMLLTLFYGVEINGSTQWILIGNFGFNVLHASPYLLLIAFAGVLHLEKEREAPNEGIVRLTILLRNVIVFAMIPISLYLLTSSMAQMLIYVLSLAILLLLSRRWRLILASGVTGTGLFAIWQMLNPDFYEVLWGRINAYIQKHPDAVYQSVKSLEAIRSGGLWGQGLDKKVVIPYATSDMLFSYLVYSFGWVFGAVIIVSSLLMAIRLFRIGKTLRDDYANKLVIAVMAVLMVRMFWNILMCLGWVPVIGMELPLILWHSGTIVEFAALGLVLGAYRRKDMVSNSAPCVP